MTDPSQVDIVYRAPVSNNPVVHTSRTCRQLEGAAVPVGRDEIAAHERVCETCRYRHVPTLEETDADADAEAPADAGERATVSPVAAGTIAVSLTALAVILTLWIAAVGGPL